MGCKASKPEEGAHTIGTAPAPGAKGTQESNSPATPPVSEIHTVVRNTAPEQSSSKSTPASQSHRKKRMFSSSVAQSASREETKQGDKLYRLLVRAQTNPDDETLIPTQILQAITPASSSYINPNTTSTPLHMAVRLLDVISSSKTGSSSHLYAGLYEVISALIQAHPAALSWPDASGHIPLHYAVDVSSLSSSHSASPKQPQPQPEEDTSESWETRASVVRLLLRSESPLPTSDKMEKDAKVKKNDEEERSIMVKQLQYLHRNNVVFHSSDVDGTSKHNGTSGSGGVGCSPLYRALQTLPDDFNPAGPTVRFIQTLVHRCRAVQVSVGNASDGDKPLALLYRRFTRQFDLAEKFFSGDNSRPQVVQHRLRYKTAAGNTWKIVETLLQRQDDDTSSTAQTPTSPPTTPRVFRTVHRAVQVETPPDLLRYIVETNPEELTVADEVGRLPLHYAALSKPHAAAAFKDDGIAEEDGDESSFPAFYSKYVIDELLYKFPEAAGRKDHDGLYPLTLAAGAGKQWIGGGIKSLYDAFPEALQQIDLEQHHILREALSITSGGAGELASSTPKEEKLPDTIIRDEQYDAIMLVQQPDVHVSEVVCSMWAHEEDAGVQMLGCVALTKMVERHPHHGKHELENNDDDNGKKSPEDPVLAGHILRIALSAVPAVVNSMKAHPNEVIVQEKACQALQALASADGKREVSFVASGAVAAIVGAMQAHVSDAGVQFTAAAAIASIVQAGAGEDRATIVASVSGLTAIVNALAAHPDNVQVQQAGCRALYELTEFAPRANLPDLPQSQAGPLLEAAKTKFPTECGQTVDVLLSRTAVET